MIFIYKMFQVENHPYLTQNKLKDFCESNSILLTAYGPLGSPYRNTNPKELLLCEPIVKQLADKYKKTAAQILIRFQVTNILYLLLIAILK